MTIVQTMIELRQYLAEHPTVTLKTSGTLMRIATATWRDRPGTCLHISDPSNQGTVAVEIDL